MQSGKSGNRRMSPGSLILDYAPGLNGRKDMNESKEEPRFDLRAFMMTFDHLDRFDGWITYKGKEWKFKAYKVLQKEKGHPLNMMRIDITEED